jgi:hypothetical protein
MIKCDSCLFDDTICSDCDYPEVDEDAGLYRDHCDLCCDLVMVPFTVRDHSNVVVCRECSKRPASDLYEELDPDVMGARPIRDFEDVFVEGDGEWWKNVY